MMTGKLRPRGTPLVGAPGTIRNDLRPDPRWWYGWSTSGAKLYATHTDDERLPPLWGDTLQVGQNAGEVQKVVHVETSKPPLWG